MATVGAGLKLEDILRRGGAHVRWDAGCADGPREYVDDLAVVVVDADYLGKQLAAVVAAWRRSAGLPGVLAIGDGEVARCQAPVARVALLAGRASSDTLLSAVQQAYRLRLACALSWPMLCAAIGQPAVESSAAAVAAAVVAARAVDLELPRTALGCCSAHYVTATALLAQVLDERRLAVPEQATLAACDGTLTLRSILQKGPLDSAQTARLIWALSCAGAVELSIEPTLGSAPQRALAEIRRHLAHRMVRLPGSTYYDVLEITPAAEPSQIEDGYRAQALRYAPSVLTGLDLGELAASVQPLWQLVEKARATLLDFAARGRYHDWLRSKGELHTVWAVDAQTAQHAGAAFLRGQQALGAGDVHRAIGELAAACRAQPGQPEYEATLAWARFRVQVAAGHDRDTLAHRERAALELLLTGVRPWPRALVALALLCSTCDDLEAARWHVQQALLAEPQMAAALQLQQRLARRA
jgi:hypothetical protein